MTGFFNHPKRHLKKLIRDGEYDEAIAFGKELESKYCNDHDFMFIMASIFFIVEDAQNALPYLDKAWTLDNADIETLVLKTDVHLALQQKEMAISCCKDILKLQPNHYKAQDLLAELESL